MCKLVTGLLTKKCKLFSGRDILTDLGVYNVDITNLKFDWSDSCIEGKCTDHLDGSIGRVQRGGWPIPGRARHVGRCRVAHRCRLEPVLGWFTRGSRSVWGRRIQAVRAACRDAPDGAAACDFRVVEQPGVA